MHTLHSFSKMSSYILACKGGGRFEIRNCERAQFVNENLSVSFLHWDSVHFSIHRNWAIEFLAKFESN